MTSSEKIEARFWKELAANPVLMVGLVGQWEGYAQPMTAQFKEAGGPIWFFATYKSALVQALTVPKRAAAGYYVAKGHDLFATVQGMLQMEPNVARIDEFWVDRMTSWYAGGKKDPDLALLRFDLVSAKIWLSGSGIGNFIKASLIGTKAVAAGQVAELSMAEQS
jgi:general stress protein 26